MNTPKKIYVAGHRGMVGSAIVRALQTSCGAGFNPPNAPCRAGFNPPWSTKVDPTGPNTIPTLITRTHAELDLTNQSAVNEFFNQEQPDQVYSPFHIDLPV